MLLILSTEYLDLENTINRDRSALLEEFEKRKLKRQINVSTDDEEVKRNLRQLGEPICIFGEGPAERRIRLRELLATYAIICLYYVQNKSFNLV